MTDGGESPDEPAIAVPAEALKTLSPAMLGSTLSKPTAASVGDITVVFSRSPDYKPHSLVDIEKMVLPPVLHGQFHVPEAMNKETGFQVPDAVATWDSVSDDVDQRLSADPAHRICMRPDEWKCGDAAWLVDLVGSPEGVRHAMQWLATEKFSDVRLKVVTRDAAGVRKVAMIRGRGSVAISSESPTP